MKKKKIFLYHLASFLIGAVAIAVYFLYKASVLQGAAGLAIIAFMPIAVVYIIAFGILCAFSCGIWITVSYLKTQ